MAVCSIKSASAQTQQPEWARVRPNAVLQVVSVGPPMFGRFRSLRSDTLSLAGPCRLSYGAVVCGPDAVDINLRSIQSVFVRKTRAGRGALLGAGLGILLGVGIGVAAGPAGDVDTPHLAAAVGAFGGFWGGVVGLLAGASTHQWQPLPVPTFSPPGR